jgi:amino acid transporter
VIFSILLGATVYILLQVVFIGAVPHGSLGHGWDHVSFTGIFGPFAGLAKGLGLAWLAYILYADAIIAPSGSALIYTTTTSRITFGMSKNGNVPEFFEKTTKKSNVPIWGLLFTFLLGLFLFLPFPGWQSLVGFITSATVLMYAGAPLALGALRHQKPDAPRPYRLHFAPVLAPASFVAASFIIYWSGWQVDWKLFVAVILGYVVMGISRLVGANAFKPDLDWAAALWLWPYLGGMALLSFLGQFGGGRQVLPFYVDLLVIGAFSLIIYYVAIRLRLPEEKVDKYVEGVYGFET